MPACNIVIDVSLSMMVSEEKISPYLEALELCTTLLGTGIENFPDQKFRVYRSSTLVCRDVQDENILKDELEKKYSKTSVKGALPWEDLLQKLQTGKNAIRKQDILIILTDGMTYKGDMTVTPHCKTRFVVCTKNFEKVDQKQLELMKDLTRRTFDIPKDKTNDPHLQPYCLYHYSNPEAMAKDVMLTALKPFEYCIRYGPFRSYVQTVPPLRGSMPGSIEYLNLVGFCDPTNLVNIPSGRNHIISALPDTDGSQSNDKPIASSSEPRESSPGVLAIITQSLAEEEWAGFVVLPSKNFGVLMATPLYDEAAPKPEGLMKKEPIGYSLTLSCLPESEDMPSYMSNLRQLKIRYLADSEDKDTRHLHRITRKRPYASYSDSRQAWTDNHGISSDIQKLFRCLRKIPDRTKLLYHEANRIRRHSLIMGYDNVLKVMADILRKEVPSLQGASKQHANYLADCFEEPIDVYNIREINPPPA